MKLHRIFLSFLLVMFHVIGLAQPRNAKTETIGGKEYYIHTVKKGETLYEISKDYKCSLADVLNANPGKENKIDVGDKIKIPVNAKNKPKNTTTTVNTNTTTTTTAVSNDKYFEHKVERGETIYGISKKYNVTADAIFELNPESKNGISPGQVLKIPGSKNTTTTNTITTPVKNEVKEEMVLFDHTVLPQETFYSISRKYNISTDSIKSLNNGLAEGLKAGNVIRLAGKKSKIELYKSWEASAPIIVNNSTIKKDSVKVNPTVTTNNVNNSSYKTGKKDVYNVGIMLPFQLDKNQKLMEEQNPLERKYIFEPTRQALDFYHGVMLALDSLKKAGLNSNLRVFDIGKDTALLKKTIAKDEFKSLDVLIGPFENIEQTAKAAKENKFPMVVPVACSNKVLLDNEYVFKSITTSSVIADATSQFIAKKYKNDNIILVDGKGKNDVGVVKSYKKFLNKYYFEQTGKTDSVKFMQLDFISNSSLPNILKKDRMNVLIIPSNDFAYVSTCLSNLNKFLSRSNNKAYQVTVFGTDEWMKWDQIDITHKLKSNVHVPSPTFVDFDTLHVHRLIRSFRNRYKTDPDKYAIMGFDLAYFWLSGYVKYGLDFVPMVPQFDVTMNQTRFNFTKMNETSGYLNKNVYILKYENYRLIPQNNE